MNGKGSANNLQMELIGKDAEVIIHNNIIEGRIIDETKNTIKIETDKGRKTIIKNQASIRIGDLEIDGKKIMKRSEERIKLKQV